MEYSVMELARLSGVSKRTLRYYDQIGLLPPARVEANGYRVYGQREVDMLQQILLYREMDMPLADIASLLQDPHFDREKALEDHLQSLLQQKERLDTLTQTVRRTLESMKGQTSMSNKEKFQGLKEHMVKENEEKYGQEVRGKYGDKVVDASNKKVLNMSESQLQSADGLRAQYESLLKEALAEGNPAGDKAQKACDLHRQWLCLYWPDGMYSKDAHRNMGDMYTIDDRFRAYYEAIAPGMTDFFRDALQIYCA